MMKYLRQMGKSGLARLLTPMSPEVQLLCKIDGVIVNIAAITNIPIDELEKGIMCVGLQASLDNATYIYDRACAGDDITKLLNRSE